MYADFKQENKKNLRTLLKKHVSQAVVMYIVSYGTLVILVDQHVKLNSH